MDEHTYIASFDHSCAACGHILRWEPYSLPGHLAIGMTCPTHGLVLVKEALWSLGDGAPT